MISVSYRIEQRITLEFAQQQPVGHQLDESARAGPVDEADLVTRRGHPSWSRARR